MKFKKSKLTVKINCVILISALLFLNVTKASAQVTIGSPNSPIKGALLDLKEKESAINAADKATFENARKGFMMPRVKLTAVDSLSVLGIDDDNPDERLKATGMVVYNVVEIDGVPEGLVVWSGEEWITTGGGGVAQSVIEDPDFSKITVEGTYVVGKSLKMSENIMVITLNVTKKGSYKITAEAVQDDGKDYNATGYTFSAIGEFATLGVTTVTLSGQGVPAKSSKEVGDDAGENNDRDDIFNIYINGKSYLHSAPGNTVKNKVLDISPEFSFSCSSIQVNGSFLQKQPVDPNANTITLRVTANNAGGEYHVYTDKVNGVWFEGRGTLLKGNQLVTLHADGIPESGGTFDYQIYSNSTSLTSNCTASVNVSFP
ncbi:MAG: hypothetical protein LBH19_13025, partial [Dysgonamonadaceae bacterium]|nr:hypothetical protein [Dysgonamonadaceae bacterium]